MGSFEDFLIDDNDELRVRNVIGAMLCVFLFISLMRIPYNMLYVEGISVTIEGRVQLVGFKYDKFWNYDYTTIEMQTYSGEDSSYTQYTFLGHLNVTFDESYRITYTRTSLLGYHFNMYNKVIEVQSLQGSANE